MVAQCESMRFGRWKALIWVQNLILDVEQDSFYSFMLLLCTVRWFPKEQSMRQGFVCRFYILGSELILQEWVTGKNETGKEGKPSQGCPLLCATEVGPWGDRFYLRIILSRNKKRDYRDATWDISSLTLPYLLGSEWLSALHRHLSQRWQRSWAGSKK